MSPRVRFLRRSLLIPALSALTSALVEAQPRRIEIIGHRGTAGLAPENTLAAFRRACAIGVDGIEFDVHLSADSVLVVHHDYSLHPDLTRDSAGNYIAAKPRPMLHELTLQQIKSYDIGRLRPGSDYEKRHPDQVPADGERIPTLDETITEFLKSCTAPTRMVVEIKTDPPNPTWSADPVTVANLTIAQLNKRGGLNRAARSHSG